MHREELDQVTKVISYHPRFLDHFLRTQNFIMKGDGPLPYDYRYYLAIIAAARHQCPYLVKMYEKEFINQGGNVEWLNGLDYIPSKLRAIYDINKILAHRPWLLRKEHIESLTKGKNSWSLSEVVHAMVLLSHFHSLSSFVFSCGLTQKLDDLSSPKLRTMTLAAAATTTTATATKTFSYGMRNNCIITMNNNNNNNNNMNNNNINNNNMNNNNNNNTSSNKIIHQKTNTAIATSINNNFYNVTATSATATTLYNINDIQLKQKQQQHEHYEHYDYNKDNDNIDNIDNNDGNCYVNDKQNDDDRGNGDDDNNDAVDNDDDDNNEVNMILPSLQIATTSASAMTTNSSVAIHQIEQSILPPITIANSMIAAVQQQPQQQQHQKTVLNEINLNQYNNTITNNCICMDNNSDNNVNMNNLIVSSLNSNGNSNGNSNADGNDGLHISDNNILIKINTTTGSFAANNFNGVNRKNGQPSATVEVIMERMKVLSQKQNECSEAELSNRFKSVEMQTAELQAAPGIKAPIEVPPVISHYIDDPNFTYRDFARRGSENIPNTFRIQDYSWDDHGYSLVNGLYEDVGTLLDQKFRCAYNLTYFTMGGCKNVDTSKFRRAIWNYIHCIYGIRHDDYDYGEVNQLLDRPLKMFIKTACCFPDRITTKDYDSILVELQGSEKVHVNLMIMEARNQAELLYALREIMRYMT